MASCAVEGGCAGDYFAILVSAIFFLMLLSRFIYPYAVHRVDRSKGSGFWIPTIQVFASFNLLLSIMLSINFLKFKKRHWWQSCILWAVWIEGPLGFGLLLSCRVTQTFQLYFIFVKRCLPPIRSFFFLPLILVPWIAGAAFMHIRKPLNDRCHMGIHWIIPTISLHALYVIALIGFTGAVSHVEFRFDELRDLWRGILVSTFTIGVWVGAYILNETRDNILWLQVASRFLILVTAGILIITLFSISSSQPLLSQISIRNRDPLEFDTMGKALGISESGLLLRREPIVTISPNEPLNKLLEDKRFRHSFMAFADSCLAGESVHFYDEVRELDKIPVDDPVRRIYMARHIIEKYIKAGSTMEVNISHRTRQEILTTSNLTEPCLFSSALNELIQLMKMNLAKDYWSSMFIVKLRDEMRVARPSDCDLDPMTSFKSSPRISSALDSDDPFHSSENSIG